MFSASVRPRNTEYQRISQLVSFQRQQGVVDTQMAKPVSETGNILFNISGSTNARMLAAFLLVGLLVVGTLTPNLSFAYVWLKIHGADKVMHWGAFFVVGLAFSGLYSSKRMVAFFIVLALSFILEFGQFFADGRIVELGDLGANILGTISGFAFLSVSLMFQFINRASLLLRFLGQNC